MKILAYVLTLFPLFASAATSLLLIGGGPRPEAALERFVQDAGGTEASIVVIPWASGSSQGALQVGRELRSLGAGQVNIAPFPRKSRLEDIIGLLENSTGVFFAGGDQNLLMDRINALELKPRLKSMFSSGVPFAGTSAGTAIMSPRMLTGEADLTVIDGTKVGITEGLGLLPDGYIVDQHFIMRSRFNRLAGPVLLYGLIGIGVDEGMAIYLRDDHSFETFGPSQVLLLRPASGSELKVQVLPGTTRGDLRSL